MGRQDSDDVQGRRGLRRDPPDYGAALAVSPTEVRACAESVFRHEHGRIIASLIRLCGSFDRAEEAIDELEQAAFITSLAPEALDPPLITALAQLCAVALGAIETAASGLGAAADVPEGRNVDSEDALSAVVRLIDAEHAADVQERTITALVFAGKYDVATSLSVLELARAIERATDRLAGFGHLLRRHIMTDLAA